MTERTKTRIAFFDMLRGLAIINMVAYHGIYDWDYLFYGSAPWFETHSAYLWEQAICWTFILLAGAVCEYSRNLAKHGGLVFACAMVLTVVTACVIPQQIIQFGVLHLLGISMLVTVCLTALIKRMPSFLSAAVCFLLFLFLKGIPRGFVGIGDIPLWYLPDFLYQFSWGFVIGFPKEGFWSSDYFPVIPWMFLFGTGMFLWRGLRPRWEKQLLRLPKISFLEKIGQHSLLIYMVHQPIIFALLWFGTHV